jgi:hypothetical protein
LLSLPGVFFLMLLIILKVRGGNKEFLHTKHSYKKDSEIKPES